MRERNGDVRQRRFAPRARVLDSERRRADGGGSRAPRELRRVRTNQNRLADRTPASGAAAGDTGVSRGKRRRPRNTAARVRPRRRAPPDAAGGGARQRRSGFGIAVPRDGLRRHARVPRRPVASRARR